MNSKHCVPRSGAVIETADEEAVLCDKPMALIAAGTGQAMTRGPAFAGFDLIGLSLVPIATGC